MDNMTNKEMESILPEAKKMLQAMREGNLSDYEKKINVATNKAIQSLEELIDDGTLKLDPEQTIKAVEVLSKSKMGIIEAKRKLLETCIKGEVMIKALDQNGKDKGKDSSALLEYLEKNGLNTKLDETGTAPGATASIFESIAKEQEA